MFDSRVLDEYIEKEIRYFRALYGDNLEQSDEELKTSFELWISHAKEYGIVNEVEVERYLNLCLLEETMLEDPKGVWINNILAWTGDSEEQKMDNLEHFFERL